MFALAHELAMRCADARFIGFPWASADTFRRLLVPASFRHTTGIPNGLLMRPHQ
jgi:hypothetical protein